MTGTLVLIAVIAAIGFGIFWVRRAQPSIPEPPPSPWKGDKITPLMAGARNKAPERVARESIMAQAVLLAVEMACADGDVDDEETAAIRQFILAQVTGADDDFADKALRDGFAAQRNTAAVDAAIETVRAVGSEEQRLLILGLLVHVAQADGRIHDAERKFMARVGQRMGLAMADVERMISLDGDA